MTSSFDMGSGEISPTIIRCNCGHRIVRKDVIHTGLYLSVLGPSYVYVRYRCGRCKRVGEKLVEQDSWDPSVLQATRPRPEEADLKRFESMGEITAEEVIDFHYALDGLGAECSEEAELA
jgi:DNA-directed RNA polymerase subunit RPC12/RpoP